MVYVCEKIVIMRHVLFLFLDGIGLGDNDPRTNPFAIANLDRKSTRLNSSH